MEPKIRKRCDFSDIDVENTAYLEYELCGDPPDFSSYSFGSKHSIVLRNIATGELEEFEFVISGDDGCFFPNARTLQGEIIADDSDKNHCILVFYIQWGKVENITASFCGKSMDTSKFAKIVESKSYGAAALADDLFFRSLEEN